MARFPSYLSMPYQVLWWEPDDFALFFSTLTIAMIYGRVSWVLPVLIPWGYGRLKRDHPRGFFRHLLYFCGITPMKKYPEFFQKDFQE